MGEIAAVVIVGNIRDLRSVECFVRRLEFFVKSKEDFVKYEMKN